MCLKKRVVGLLFLILLVPFVFGAVYINEVELDDLANNEWVELYNDAGIFVDLTDWELHDNVGNIYTFTETIGAGGFLVVDVSGLNNVGETITLYDDLLTIIDSASISSDNDNDDKTWQRIPDGTGGFVFQPSTKNLSNSVGDININGIGNYATIQDAIDAANAGDVINLGAGIYEEDLQIPVGKNNLEIKTSESATIKGVANIDVTSWPIVAPNIEILSDGVKIQGFIIESPDYVSSKYTSGIVIGAKDVQIYDNNFIINSATNTDEISQVIQTYSSVSMPGVDISGLNISKNNFTHKGGGNWGYEAIYINPDGELRMIYIKNNNIGGKVLRAMTLERSKAEIEENEIITEMGILPDGWIYAGAWQGINIRKSGSQSQITVNKNILKGVDITKGFKEGIKIGQAGQLFSNILVEENILNYNEKAIITEVGLGIKVNYNTIIGNDFGIQNNNVETLNAESNYWGDCTGPGVVGSGNGDNVSVNVDFTPWLGVCLNEKSEDKSCILESDNVTLYVNLTSQVCIGEVIFSVLLNGSWKNFTGIKNGGDLYYTIIDNSLLEGGQTINWTVYAEDCYNHTEKNGIEEFYVKSRTRLDVSPLVADGENGWYTLRPQFILTNLNATNSWYRWDGTGNILYTGQFGLEDAPNNQNKTGGIAQLSYWSDVCDESEQIESFKFDFTDPVIKNLVPENDSLVRNNKPTISAYIDEVYQSNSGVNLSSIVVEIDGVEVSADKSITGNVDAVVSYVPTINLSDGQHEITIYVEDNSGRSSELSWTFVVNTTIILDIDLFSPENKIYNMRRIPFNLTALENIEKIEYYDWNDRRPRWKRICRNCDEYGNSKLRRKSFSEGPQNLSFRATNIEDEIVVEDTSFIVETKMPKMRSVSPRRGLTKGDFSVKFTEANPVDVFLSYKNKTDSGNKKVNLSSCEVERGSWNCEVNADLLEYDGLEIEYWFNVTDILGNSSISRRYELEVDTTDPKITKLVYFIERTYLNLEIGVDEINFKEITYLDLNDLRGREKRLCSRLRGGECEKRIRFKGDTPNIKVIVRDDVDNFVEQIVS